MNTKKLFISLIAALAFGTQFALAADVPESVTNLEATTVDSGSIGLTWDAAKDSNGAVVSKYRIYYGTTSVFTAGAGDYDSQVDTTDNSTSYILDGLTADTTYYFSATAIDSNDVESEEYSLEASATTDKETSADTTSPTVTSVSAPDNASVKVVFSETVALPTANPEASFTIIEQINPINTLTVSAATMDSSDSTNKTVLLTTAEQTANVNYIVTVGVAIKDTAGNPIISGSTDSGLFLGSATVPTVESESAEDDKGENETITPAPVTTPTTTTFDCVADMETCFLSYLDDCETAKVVEKDDTYEYTLEITKADGNDCVVKYTADKHPNILFASTDMECKVAKGTYNKRDTYLEAFDLDTKCSGDLQAGYKAVTVATTDTTPPENITNLLLTFKQVLEQYSVMFSWTASLDTAKDLADQLLYQSLDRGTTYDSGKSLGATSTTSEVSSLDAGKEYTFKVTTKDTAGNESTGVVKSIRLPQTGMGIGFALMGSLYAAHRVLGRRKEDGEL